MREIDGELSGTESLINRALLELRYQGDIDPEICQDINDHWERDVAKLKATQEDGVAIEKIIGYYAFWVRKLQPVTNAYPFIPNEEKDGYIVINDKSNTHINELVSIYVIKILALLYFEDKIQEYSTSKINGFNQKIAEYRAYIDGVEKHFTDLFDSINSPELYKSFLRVCLYDMRYRTFGPHHFTHAVRFLMYNSGVDLKSVNSRLSSIGVNKSGVSKRILKLTVFISAPGDVQEGYIYDLPAVSISIKRIIKNKNDEWIDRFHTVVVCLAQKDVPSKLSTSYSQEVVNEFIVERGVDAYCGILKHNFGSPTKAGFGSGTEEEYNLAINGFDPDFILFGISIELPDYNSMTPAQRKKAMLDSAKIEKFKKKYGNNQFIFDWDDQSFEKTFIYQIEELIKRFSSRYG